MPIVARTVAAMREHVALWKAEGDLVAIVPTMGALHDGHLALVRAAQRDCSRVIVTIFVNPTQFAEDEDLEAYPRGEAADLAKLQALAADLAFLPGGDQMYPDGFATSVRIEGLTEVLCGLGRPAHFGGVATVVSKLFNQSQADRAYFGEKDYQQSLVVRRWRAIWIYRSKLYPSRPFANRTVSPCRHATCTYPGHSARWLRCFTGC